MVRVLAEGERLSFGHLFNPAFATGVSQIDPLPHQRIAVYLRHVYNRAKLLNRSAARLAMSVLQRRLASSTYALLRSFDRRQSPFSRRWLMGMQLYGGGLRLNECLQQRGKDLDFERLQATVRDGKREKDRVTLLPEAIVEALKEHLANVRKARERALSEFADEACEPLDKQVRNDAMAARVRMQAVGEVVQPGAVAVERPIHIDQFDPFPGGHVAHGLCAVPDQEVDAVFAVGFQMYTRSARSRADTSSAPP